MFKRVGARTSRPEAVWEIGGRAGTDGEAGTDGIGGAAGTGETGNKGTGKIKESLLKNAGFRRSIDTVTSFPERRILKVLCPR